MSSARKIMQLEHELQRYHQMEQEFITFMNIVIRKFGKDGEVLFITRPELMEAAQNQKVVRTERISTPEDGMEFRLLEMGGDGAKPEQPSIIVPPGFGS
jgi:hypothetical protein